MRRSLDPRSGGWTALLILSLSALCAQPAWSQEAARTNLASTLNVVGQTADLEGVRSEVAASVDIFADVRLGPLRIHSYLEANSTPRADGVSASLPLVNADAGTAVDGDGNGRLQLSEIRLALPVSKGSVLHVGLMDLTGFLDVSRIANDENLYFLGQPFVNNTTILFPDYTLGSVLESSDLFGPVQVALAVSSSHGLADTPRLSYGDLLELSAPGRGLFTAARLRFETEQWTADLGGWTNSGDRSMSGAYRPPTRGLYGVAGWHGRGSSVSARLGVANGGSRDEVFLGLTYLGTLGSNAVGIGIARLPTRLPGTPNAGSHAEAFLRRSLFDSLFLTISAQRLSPELLPDDRHTDDAWVTGFRVSVIL